MLSKYQLRMYYSDGDKNTAGSKAAKDCCSILSTIGFQTIDIPIYSDRSYKFINAFQALKAIYVLLLKIRADDVLLIQYPLLGINKYLKIIAKGLRFRKCKSIVLIHDLDSLRKHGAYTTLEDEVSRLNLFDHVISHNSSMTDLLKKKGLLSPVVELNLFDYLSSAQMVKERHSDLDFERRSIAFAGSLGKSGFIKDLNKVKKIKFVLYGPGYNESYSGKNLEWKGSFPPEELPKIITAEFGLIWDGDSIDQCNGIMGEYLKYNNPHKASLYIVSQLPLIASNQSAVGKYIKEKDIGIVIGSLCDLEEIFNNLTIKEYWDMKNNIRDLSKLISSGSNLKRCVTEIGLE